MINTTTTTTTTTEPAARFETLTLPAWLAPVLVYSDETGCDNRDTETIDHLTAYLTNEGLGLCVNVSEMPEFYHSAPRDAWQATGCHHGGDFLEFTFEKI